MPMQIVIFAGGVSPADPGALPDGAFVIAADSGIDAALAAGVDVDLLVGDLDSASSWKAREIRRFSTDKDETDLELAVRAARERGATSILVIGGGGGRIDHFFANASLLATQDGMRVEWRTGTGVVYRVQGKLVLHGRLGEKLSLLAFGGWARGVHTEGLRWHLDGDDLSPGITRGVSNEFAEETATVRVTGGDLLVVMPER